MKALDWHNEHCSNHRGRVWHLQGNQPTGDPQCNQSAFPRKIYVDPELKRRIKVVLDQ